MTERGEGGWQRDMVTELPSLSIINSYTDSLVCDADNSGLFGGVFIDLYPNPVTFNTIVRFKIMNNYEESTRITSGQILDLLLRRNCIV